MGVAIWAIEDLMNMHDVGENAIHTLLVEEQ